MVLQKELERLGYRVQAAPDGEAALRRLEESNVDVLLCDINMPRIDGMELLRRVHERPNPPEVIMLTGQATVETAVEAMKLGAYDYLTKPYHITELDIRVKQAAEKRRLRVDNLRLREQLARQSGLPEIVSVSDGMKEAVRLVETRTFFRVGGVRKVEVNVRIVAATNRNLDSVVADGSFRSDLLYRINGFQIDLTPLRERSEDIEPLTRYLLNEVGGTTKPELDPQALDALKTYSWPGNVRQLKNCLERAVILSNNG